MKTKSITLQDILDLLDEDLTGVIALRIVGPDDGYDEGLSCQSDCCLLGELGYYPVESMGMDKDTLIICLKEPDKEDDDAETEA